MLKPKKPMNKVSQRPKVKLINSLNKEEKCQKNTLKPSNRLYKQSIKQAERNALYKILKKEYMCKHKVCEICNKNSSSSLHHRALRKGFNLIRFFMALCHSCHTKIHDHTKEAKRCGLILDINPKEEHVNERIYEINIKDSTFDEI